MRLFVAALLLAALALSGQAASWDGTKGPFTVATFTFSSGTGTNLPGVPIIPGPLVWHTTIFIKCADPTVSAALVKIQYRDSSGDHSTILVAEFYGGYGGVTLPIPTDQITEAPKFTELRAGATY
jgi:hypothetical protein